MSEEEIREEMGHMRQHRSQPKPKLAEGVDDKAEAARKARMAKMALKESSEEVSDKEASQEAVSETLAPPSGILGEHTVVSGDNLSHIAQKYYNSSARDKWMAIYEANKEVIGDNPSLIRVGQVLKIPRLSE